MKASIITPQSLHKSSEEKSLKHEGKMSDKHSPEYRLGIGIEKLLEQGVRVEKIDDVVNNSNGKIDKVPIKKGFARATNKNVCLVKGKSKRRRRRFIMINGKRERVAKLTKNQAENKDSIVTNFKSGTVKNAVEACLKSMVQFQSKNQLLDEGLPLNLQISSIRKAVMPKRFVRFQLPHSYLDDLADICLIVPDEKSWNNKLKDPELTINETQDFLRTNDVSCVKKILTLHQLKTEYMVHEMRRKLCNSYDYFLADHRLADEIHTHLGKEFQKQRKGPVSIKMHRGNLKARVNKALAKSVMKLSSDQDTFSCRIGHSKQDIDELVDNIVAVGQQLDTFFPGNFKNVRSVSLKSSRSIGFPVYYSTKPVNEVPRPIVAPKRPKMYEVATDELSTIGKQVQVHPDGTVTVVDDQPQSKKSKNNLNVNKATKSPAKKNVPVKKEEEEEEEEEEEDEPNSDEEFEIDSDDDFDDNVEEEVDSDSNSPFTFEKKKKNSKTVTKVDGSDESGTDESDTEDEDFSRKTEEAYLQSLGGDSDSEEEDDDDEEVEKEEEKEEVKQKEVKDQKKRKTPEIKDAKNVSPKKFKPSAPAEQPALSKAKGNINSTIPKQANPPSNKQKAKAVKRKTFDTSLGETWSIKKKCDAPAGEKVAPKKKNRSKSKLNKSQKKGNMKMKKAKQNKD